MKLTRSLGPHRRRLANRRPNRIETIEVGGRSIVACFGLDTAGRVREVFADGAKSGSDLETAIDDAATLLSLALQSGYRAQDLVGRFSRDGILGALVRRAAETRRGRRRPMMARPGGVQISGGLGASIVSGVCFTDRRIEIGPP